MEAEVAGREVELLVVGRVVGDVHLAMYAGNATVGVEDDCCVVVKPGCATLEKTCDEHDAILPCHLGIELRSLARNG